MALDDYRVTTDVERAVGQGIYQESEFQNSPLGSELVLNDGRKFRYCKNGSVALAAGKLTSSPAWVSTETALGVNTASKGDTVLLITTGSTVTANQYAGGFVFTEDDTGEGQMLKIKSHAAADSAEGRFVLWDPVRVAFGADTTVGLVYNRFDGTLVTVDTDNTETETPVGVPLIPVTGSYYYWAQYKGLCNVLNDGTMAIGEPLMRGAVTGALAVATSAFKEIATMHHTAEDTEYRPVILSIA